MQRTVCVFGGVAKTSTEKYAVIAYNLGRLLGDEGVVLICNGTRRGMLGALIEGASSKGGRVVAAIVEGSGEAELIHPRVDECVQSHSLADRKNMMLRMADSFIALPGGIGTLDEVFNVIASARMGLHEKKAGLLDVDGFFAPLSDLFEKMVEAGFLKPRDLDRIIIERESPRLLERLWRL